MIQNVLIGLTFIGALAYLSRMLYRNLNAKTACSTGCGKCNAIDFSKIEEKLKAQEPSIKNQ